MEPPPRTWPKIDELTDRYGNTIQYGNAGDFWLPPFPIGQDSDYKTHARRIRDMEIRPDDVIAYSYPKAGLHWHYAIVEMLQAKSAAYSPKDLNVGFLDALPMAAISQLPSPRFLQTHVPFSYFPKQALEKKVKIVILERNLKDVLVSLFCHLHAHKPPIHFPGTFFQFYHLVSENEYKYMYYGNFFDHLLKRQEGIEAHPEVDFYTSVYEDMKQDPVQGIIKLNDYLGTGCSPKLCQEIADACSFSKLQPVRDAQAPTFLSAMFEEGSSAFYRKGQVGDWKNWFTVAMNEDFEQKYNKRMSGYKLQYKYTLE